MAVTGSSDVKDRERRKVQALFLKLFIFFSCTYRFIVYLCSAIAENHEEKIRFDPQYIQAYVFVSLDLWSLRQFDER